MTSFLVIACLSGVLSTQIPIEYLRTNGVNKMVAAVRVDTSGATDTYYGESFIERTSASDEDFYFKNSGSGVLNVRLDGVIELGDFANLGDGGVTPVEASVTTAGAMYFNTTWNKFRCRFNASWSDCAPTSLPPSIIVPGTPGQILMTGADGGTQWNTVSGDLTVDGTGAVTVSKFHGSGSTTDAVDLATAEVSGSLPVANLVSGSYGQVLMTGPLDAGVWATISGAISLSPTGVATLTPNNLTIDTVDGGGLAGGGSVVLGGTLSIDMRDTAVTPGSYTLASLTVDQKGRLTAASNGSTGVSGTSGMIPKFTGATTIGDSCIEETIDGIDMSVCAGLYAPGAYVAGNASFDAGVTIEGDVTIKGSTTLGNSVADIVNVPSEVRGLRVDGGVGLGFLSFWNALTGTPTRSISVDRADAGGQAGAHLSISAGGAVFGGTDKAGGNLTLKAGQSTGNAGSSVIITVHSPDGGSGTGETLERTAATFSGYGDQRLLGDYLPSSDSYVYFPAPTGNVILNTTPAPFQVTSIVIGADDLPVVSYVDPNTGKVYLHKCSTATCVASDSTFEVGTSVALYGKGMVDGTLAKGDLPIFVWDNHNAGMGNTYNLLVARCTTAACSAISYKIFDTVGVYEGRSAVTATFADGTVGIAHMRENGSNFDVVYKYCSDPEATPPCSSAGADVWVSSETPGGLLRGDFHNFMDITIVGDDTPLIITGVNVNYSAIRVYKCSDKLCSSSSVTVISTPAGYLMNYRPRAVTMGDGNASFFYSTYDNPKNSFHCSNVSCTSVSGNFIPTGTCDSFVGTASATGYPIILSANYTGGVPYSFISCDSYTCLGTNTYTQIPGTPTGIGGSEKMIELVTLPSGNVIGVAGYVTATNNIHSVTGYYGSGACYGTDIGDSTHKVANIYARGSIEGDSLSLSGGLSTTPLQVSGNSVLSGNATVTQNMNVYGNVVTTGVTTTGTLVTGQTTITGSVYVSDSVTSDGGMTVQNQLVVKGQTTGNSAYYSDSVVADGGLGVQNNATIGGDLSIGANTTIAGEVSVKGGVVVDGGPLNLVNAQEVINYDPGVSCETAALYILADAGAPGDLEFCIGDPTHPLMYVTIDGDLVCQDIMGGNTYLHGDLTVDGGVGAHNCSVTDFLQLTPRAILASECTQDGGIGKIAFNSNEDAGSQVLCVCEKNFDIDAGASFFQWMSATGRGTCP